MTETPFPRQSGSPKQEYNRPHNVWKRYDDQPPAPKRHTFLTLFTVPVEILFRYDFGQRWLTVINVLGGLLILLLFVGLEWGFRLFVESEAGQWLQGFLSGLFNLPTDCLSFVSNSPLIMPWFLAVYTLRGSYHFFRMFWRNRVSTSKHSFDSGTSLFEFAAVWIMRLINLIAYPFIYVGMIFLPSRERRRRKSAPRLLNNISLFTDTVIEPLMLLAFAWITKGVPAVWLGISAMVAFTHARRRAGVRKNKRLDFRDSRVEAQDMRHYYASGKQIIKDKGKAATRTKKIPKRKRRALTNLEEHRSKQPGLHQIIEDFRRAEDETCTV